MTASDPPTAKQLRYPRPPNKPEPAKIRCERSSEEATQ
jgi:hypothetical protein